MKKPYPEGNRSGAEDPERAGSPAIVRTRRDAAAAAAGAGILCLSALPVSEDKISGAERAVFNLVNGVPGLPFGPLWLLMQLGNIVVVPVAAIGALLARRPRLAASIALSGAVTYGLAKVVKRFVTRDRPSTLIADAEIRGAAAHGLGFVSGHAAVIAALATVAFPYLSPRWRWVAAGLAAFVAVARVYVAAHLPLDVVGGAGLGLLVGSLVKVACGSSKPCS